MKMIEVLGAFVLGGAAGAIVKDKLVGSTQQNNIKNEMEQLYAENEKFSKRNKEMEREIEDLMSELKKARRKVSENDDNNDDLEDDLDRAKRELKNLKIQNDELTRKIKEYKTACESQEAEIAMLKQKLG